MNDRDTSSTDKTAQNLDREHEQLFHELRAIIPGAEVLFAFLLTVAFTERFQDLTRQQRGVYYTTFLLAAVALVLLLAPSSFHRLRFRKQDKEALLRAANIETVAALVCVSLAVGGSVLLITDLLFRSPWGPVVAVTLWAATASLWWLYPLTRRRHD